MITEKLTQMLKERETMKQTDEYSSTQERFNSLSAKISGSAVFTSYFAIFRDQTHNKYSAYLFRAVQTVLQKV